MKILFLSILIIPVLFISCSKDDTSPLPNPENPRAINDPLFKDQWYLKNSNPAEVDINVSPIWDKNILGNGINIGIIDYTVQYNHPDLKDNLLNANQIKNNPLNNPHGTRVAGIIAASANNIGIHGIAPNAKFYSYGFLDDDFKSSNLLFTKVAQFFNRGEKTNIAVYNASFGFPSRDYTPLKTETIQAMDNVLKDGFKGKGSSIVFSAGNNIAGLEVPSNDGFLNHYGVITVNSVLKNGDPISVFSGTFGTNLWISAPTSKSDDIITTDLTGSSGEPGDYTKKFGATSGAAPMVTGTIALLREKYPQLTWRDIKLILAESANKIASSKRTYTTTGKMYSNPTQNQSYDTKTGFGMVNAYKAYQLAENWIPLPTLKTKAYTQNVAVTTPTTNAFAISKINILSNDISFIESITVEVEFEKTEEEVFFVKRDLVLEAPNGKEAYFFKWDGNPTSVTRLSYLDKGVDKMTLLTNEFLGSKITKGKSWKLKLKQNPSDRTITKIKSWKLIIRGH